MSSNNRYISTLYVDQYRLTKWMWEGCVRINRKEILWFKVTSGYYSSTFPDEYLMKWKWWTTSALEPEIISIFISWGLWGRRHGHLNDSPIHSPLFFYYHKPKKVETERVEIQRYEVWTSRGLNTRFDVVMTRNRFEFLCLVFEKRRRFQNDSFWGTPNKKFENESSFMWLNTSVSVSHNLHTPSMPFVVLFDFSPWTERVGDCEL